MTRTVSLPFKDWPDVDQAMWADLVTPGDVLGNSGALSHLRATSLAGLLKIYGRWLEWLIQADPEALEAIPFERATTERVALWIASLDHVTAPTRATLVNGMLRVVSAANPHGNWRAEFRLLKALQRAARTAPSRRKLGRILLSSELLNAGLVLAGQRADRANTLLNAQLGRRDGTMIAFLALIPIRLRSLSELELGRSVLVGETEICIVLTSEMTKNGRPWETTVPSALAPVLRRYIDDVRPWLMARSSQSHHSLWVGRMGEPLAYKTLSNLIPEATSRVLGVRVSPHLFRDAAATTLARTSPADTRLIRPLLAHSSDAIAERHYNHAQGIEAGRGLAALITKLTKEDA